MSQTDANTDILMNFTVNGVQISGESNAALMVPGKPRHKMLSGFTPGCIFELDTFSFAVSVEDPNANGGQGAGKAGAKPAGKPSSARGSTVGQFQGWRGGSSQAKYPVSVQPVTFTRQIDLASTTLLQYCINSTSFDSATLVKRKPAGGRISGEPFLRIDFTGVLLTDVSWSNDDPVKETVKFISRAITVSYRPQLTDGSLGAVVQGFYAMNPSEREVILT